jgi:cephalosporin hydroxylase
LMGHGQIVSIDETAGTERPQHPRIAYVTGRAHTDKASDRVREITNATANAFVVLGSVAEAGRTTQQFERYAPFVSVGSFVVVEHTIVNGHPVWPGFGNGPHEAIPRILARHPEFVQDTSVERHGLTFNPGGFLRRVAQ